MKTALLGLSLLFTNLTYAGEKLYILHSTGSFSMMTDVEIKGTGDNRQAILKSSSINLRNYNFKIFVDVQGYHRDDESGPHDTQMDPVYSIIVGKKDAQLILRHKALGNVVAKIASYKSENNGARITFPQPDIQSAFSSIDHQILSHDMIQSYGIDPAKVPLLSKTTVDTDLVCVQKSPLKFQCNMGKWTYLIKTNNL